MSELRFDPVKQKWSVIATERSRRPHDFLVERHEHAHGEKAQINCPFCYGNEVHTPHEIYAMRSFGKKNDANWLTRVVPNKYPAFGIEGELKRSGSGIYDTVTGIGAHEVIIDTPVHSMRLKTYDRMTVYNLFYTFRERVRDLSNDTRFRYIMPFKNYGLGFGTNIIHPHSQVIALPVVPNILKTKLKSAKEHYRRKERCIFCDILEQEHKDNSRIVYENQDFIAFCPYASSFPFELSIYPKQHAHSFAVITESGLTSLADMITEIFHRLDRVLEDPPLNMVIHTSPPLNYRPGKPDFWHSIKFDYHWHIEIAPRLTGYAGFEWGTGFHINPVRPEEAAEYLRQAGGI
ncbi:galactose-1-phosphate uridylyltransferase [Geovibrio thiophilus]|uniref:Galactose-1-phosphate uridylyltransferase n=1 Tax=Geovibrio thiophilus TaxID=139438 RepID=A0A3R6AZX9_9BACT|nr:galactose-1-phosphate uridylyltransferase [Geovibrio thiophilus]QAR34372.1 galactose-1-phosphate uridylyltransferase [Geovibrio thiophilus]